MQEIKLAQPLALSQIVSFKKQGKQDYEALLYRSSPGFKKNQNQGVRFPPSKKSIHTCAEKVTTTQISTAPYCTKSKT